MLRKAGSYPASCSKNFALESRGRCQSCSHTRLHPAVLLSGLTLLSVAWGTSLGLIQSSHTLSASDVPPGSIPARGTYCLEAAAWAVGRQDLRRLRLESFGSSLQQVSHPSPTNPYTSLVYIIMKKTNSAGKSRNKWHFELVRCFEHTFPVSGTVNPMSSFV